MGITATGMGPEPVRGVRGRRRGARRPCRPGPQQPAPAEGQAPENAWPHGMRWPSPGPPTGTGLSLLLLRLPKLVCRNGEIHRLHQKPQGNWSAFSPKSDHKERKHSQHKPTASSREKKDQPSDREQPAVDCYVCGGHSPQPVFAAELLSTPGPAGLALVPHMCPNTCGQRCVQQDT